MGSQGDILVERSEDIVTLTISRPEKRNALGSATAGELAHTIETAAPARVIVITGAGDSFCAGGDLEELERWSDLPQNEISGVLYASFQAMIRNIRRSSAVVIAAINGAAVGAGMDLALACDLRVASEDARLGQVWVRLGVIPGTGGAWLTQALAGPGRAAELLLTGDSIDARAALEAGLVNRVVPREELDAAVEELAQSVLRHPPAGVVANKRAYVQATDAAVEAALEHAVRVQPERFTSEEFRTAVRAVRSGS